jgi:Ca-activated chloride channel family protein
LQNEAIGEARAFEDAETGLRGWRRARPRERQAVTPCVEGGRVVFDTESCTGCVVPAEDGERVWKRWLGDPLLAQPAVAGETLLMAYPDGSRERRLAAFRLADIGGLWQAWLPSDGASAPVGAGSWVYAGLANGELIAFETGAPADDGWPMWGGGPGHNGNGAVA